MTDTPTGVETPAEPTPPEPRIVYRHTFTVTVFNTDPEWSEAIAEDDETGGEDLGMEADQGFGFHYHVSTVALSEANAKRALALAGYDPDTAYASLQGNASDGPYEVPATHTGDSDGD